MTDKRAMIAFKLKEPVTVILRDCRFEGTIQYIKIGFNKTRLFSDQVNGADRKIVYSYEVMPNDNFTIYTASAEQMHTDIPEISKEYQETIIKSLIGLH